MSKYLRLCSKELSGNLSFSLFFVFNLALGLVGFGLLDSFRVSFQKQVNSQSRELMGADFRIRANVPLPKKIDQLVSQEFNSLQRSEKVQFFSMVQAGIRSRLVNIHAIDSQFPLVGNFELEGSQVESNRSLGEHVESSRNCYLYPELGELLDINLGDTIKVGHADFIVAGWVRRDPSSLFSSLGLAPRLFMALDQIEETGLIRLGSRIQYSSYYSGNELINLRERLNEGLKKRMNAELEQSDRYQIRLAGDASGRINRGMQDLSHFLGLVAMVALFLAGTGAAFIYRAYLTSRVRSIAILISQGMNRTQVGMYYLVQLGFLGILASILGIITAHLMLPVVSKLLAVFLPRELSLLMPQSTYFLMLSMGGIGSVLFCLPFLTRIRLVQPRQLFQEGSVERLQIPKFDFWFIASSVLLLISTWTFACLQSNSLFIGSIFFVGVMIGVAIMAIICQLLLIVGRKLMDRFSLIWRMAWKDLVRKRFSTLTSFLCIGLGSLLIALMPQMQKNLELRLERPQGFTLPTFFLFDMQPEQLDSLKKVAQSFSARMAHVSPMIRARVEQIKGVDLQKYVDDRTPKEIQRGFGRMLLRRGANLSYRPTLADSETILEGEPLETLDDFDWQKPVPLSLETRFAKELELNIGDKISFDIQGLPLEGVVQNIRKVSWNSFQPNFFIILPAGVLNEAPMTVLGTITGLKSEDKASFQKSVLKDAPNVSFVDVQEVIKKVIYVLDQLVVAVYLLAALAIISGLVVLYSIARYEVRLEAWMFSLLKVLGADFKILRHWIVVRFGILGFLASAVGILLSLVFAYTFWVLVVKDSWYWVIDDVLILCPIITLVCIATALIASQKILQARPQLFLDAR